LAGVAAGTVPAPATLITGPAATYREKLTAGGVPPLNEASIISGMPAKEEVIKKYSIIFCGL
jgi:hypothetical protein